MSLVSTSEPVQQVEFDSRSTAFQADPYPTYALLREHEPFAYREENGFASWCVTRHADVVAVLRDPRFSAAETIGDLQQPGVPEKFRRLGEMLGHMMLRKDDPDHSRLRGLVNRAFSPRVIEGLRPRIETIVEHLLGVVTTRGQGEMDVIRDLATPLPVIVIAELLGVPTNDQGRFKKWSDDIAVVLDGTVRDSGLPAAAQSAYELAEYLRGVIAERRKVPREDLISGMIAARDEEDALTDDELVANCVLILLAGHETTTNLIGNGVLALLRNPDQMALLRDDPKLANGAVEECLRYDPPIQLTSRNAVGDLVFSGVHMADGVELNLMFGAANRDGEKFDDPERFDIRRDASGHVSFGHGTHFCLGATLARLEAEVVFRGLATRMSRLELSVEDPPRRPGIVIRGLASLPVRF
jgi:cytochrome P450